MPEFDDDEGFGGGGGERTPRSFDPLFDSWADDTPSEPVAASHDDLFAFAPVPVAPETEETDWQRPYTPASPDYPHRYQPEYQERLTELQRRLREETVVVPHAESRWVVTVRELAETLLLAVLIFLAVRASFQNFKVEGASMNPSLDNGEYLIVNKLSYAQMGSGLLDWLPFVDSGNDDYLWDSPSRGDVIVFRAPTSVDRDFIKRIIGVPGDTVELNNETGEVHVNGHLLSEPYIQGNTNCGAECTYHIPAAGTDEAFERCGSSECFFVMGDNRQNSSDSRQDWLVPKENIIGKALITYWHEGGPELDLAPNHTVGSAEEATD
ncbi:MAG: signal peptidase I [Dehalococcoidia bacterium]